MKFTRHGEKSGGKPTPEYEAYTSARARCCNPKKQSYVRYGGRGIEFRFNSFQELLDEVGRRPSAEHSLDRIDNNGHYERGNVRWSTRSEQANNRTSNRIITAYGRSLTVTQWERLAGFGHTGRIEKRLDKHKWCNECAVSLSKRAKCPHREETA